MKATFFIKNHSVSVRLTMIALLGFGLSFPGNAQKKILYHSLEMAYIGINVADYYTTYLPGGQEANPLVKSIVSNRQQFIIRKAIAGAIVLGTCRLLGKKEPKLAIISLASADLIMGYCAFHNYQIYLRFRL